MAAKKSYNSMVIATGAALVVVLGLIFFGSQDWKHGRNRILDLVQANLGDAHARYDYAVRLDKNGKKDAAMTWYEKAADGGYVPAMMAIADSYGDITDEETGDTVVKWYKKAAAAGNSEAMRKLGNAYAIGRGSLQPSTIMARSYYEKAAQAGDLRAKTLFGAMLVNEGKLKEAEGWLLQAAAAGDGEAALDLGNIYYDYRSPLKDATKAAHYYEQAANAGFSEIMFNYAYIQYYGNGVKKDPVEAYKWVLIASEVREREMSPAAYFLRQKLTPEQLKDGEQRAEQWRQSHPKVRF